MCWRNSRGSLVGFSCAVSGVFGVLRSVGMVWRAGGRCDPEVGRCAKSGKKLCNSYLRLIS